MNERMAITISDVASFFAIGVGIVVIVGTLLAIGGWLNGLKTDREKFNKFIDKVERKLEEIFESITDLRLKTNPATQKKSPISLTELGEKVSKEIEGESVSEELAKKLSGETTDLNAYEIQKFSLDFIHNRFKPDENYSNKLKDSAYNNGLTLRETKDVLALELRDALLKSVDG